MIDSGTDYSRPHAPVSFMRRARDYFWRAAWWQCPVCGLKPMFPPLGRTRSLNDWLTPLDGCPHCGYAYDREPGYFLWSVWALGYIVSAVVGIGIYVYLQIWHSDWSILATIVAVMIPLPFINMLFARHAKSLFLAADHLADPHVGPGGDGDDGDGGGGGGGGPGLRPAPAPLDVPAGDADGGPSGKRSEAETEPVAVLK